MPGSPDSSQEAEWLETLKECTWWGTDEETETNLARDQTLKTELGLEFIPSWGWGLSCQDSPGH